MEPGSLHRENRIRSLALLSSALIGFTLAAEAELGLLTLGLNPFAGSTLANADIYAATWLVCLALRFVIAGFIVYTGIAIRRRAPLARILFWTAMVGSIYLIMNGILFMESVVAGISTITAGILAFADILGAVLVLIGVWSSREASTESKTLGALSAIAGGLIILGVEVAGVYLPTPFSTLSAPSFNFLFFFLITMQPLPSGLDIVLGSTAALLTITRREGNQGRAVSIILAIALLEFGVRAIAGPLTVLVSFPFLSQVVFNPGFLRFILANGLVLLPISGLLLIWTAVSWLTHVIED